MPRNTGKKTVPEPPVPQPGILVPAPLKAQRRPKMVGLGVALIALSALGGVALANTLSNTHPVVALATDVPRGQAIQATDLVTVEIPDRDTALTTISADQAPTLVGAVAKSDLHAGTTLSPEEVSTTIGLDQGTALVGVALSPQQAPGNTLRDGDTVTLVQVAVAGAPPIESPKTWKGRVVSTHTSPSDQAVKIVDVQVDKADAAKVASLSASNQIALILNAQE